MSGHVWMPPVADDWWMVADVGAGVTRLVELHVNPVIESNVWHVRGRDADLLIDSGNGIGALRPLIDRMSQGRPLVAVVTHGHFDHVGGLREFDDRRGHPADADDVLRPYAMRLHQADYPEGAEEMFAFYGFPTPRSLVEAIPHEGFDMEGWSSPGAELTATVDEGTVIDLGDRRLEVLHTPGHTPGSISIWESDTGLLFTGDTVYVEGRLHFEDPGAALVSLDRLCELPVRRVHAGHDRSFDARELKNVTERERASIVG